MKRTVIRMLDDAVKAWNNEPYALKKSESGYTARSFREVKTRAMDFAAWLQSRHWGRGDNIAILAEGSPEWMLGEFGILMAGAASVPLSIKLLAEEIPFRLNHSESRAILTTRNQLEKVLGALSKVDNKAIIIVYLDDDLEEAGRCLARFGFGKESFIGICQAMEMGQSLLADASSRTKERLERTIEDIAEDDIATISYTSGTTGNPKGIMLTHFNYWTNCHDGVDLFRMPKGFRTLVVLPVDHSFAHTAGLYIALIIGMSLYFVDSRGGGIATLRNIPINLKEANPTILLTVPALSGNFMKKIISGIEEKGGFIEKLFKAGIAAGIAWNGDGFNRPKPGVRFKAFFPYRLAKALVFNKVKKMVFGTSIKYCVGGGALLDIKQQEFFAAFGVPVYQGYGLTEATPIISSNSPVKHKFGTSGITCPSIEVKLIKGDGTEAAIGENGEIVIRGGSVMKGYYRNPEETARALRDGWLYTGDLAHWDSDGFLVVVGREKALLIAEDGEKYSPEEIEEAVTTSTAVIDQIMVWCEQRKYAIALVSLDTGKVERLLKEKDIQTAQVAMDFLKDEFYAFRNDPKAKKVQNAWVPAVFQIVKEGFSEKDGTINSTMKLVRHRVSELHNGLIEYSYTRGGGDSIINERNLEAVRSLFGLK